jgi:hypothetical protein
VRFVAKPKGKWSDGDDDMEHNPNRTCSAYGICT